MYLTKRWTPLRYHAEQRRLWTSDKRFCVVPAGRRSGKTELAKRKLVTKLMRGTEFTKSNFFAAAPTRDQAKRIFWEDLKALIPKKLVKGRPKESDLSIELIHGPSVTVVGLDVPERIEGSPWDWGVLDEYGNMKKKVWDENVRPALADRQGGCWLIGVPEGRNHYYQTYKDAKSDTTGEWDAFHWFSSDILPAKEIESARDKLDELTFQQEFEGSFLNFQGRIYHPYEEKIHAIRLKYDIQGTLILCFDFNVAPGVCAIVQEQELTYFDKEGIIRTNAGTGVIGEVYIQRDSNTERVCKELVSEWGNHKGPVICYGDSTGGAKGSAKIKGSDWDIIKAHLRRAFGTSVEFRYPARNPPERSRINSLNSRLMSSSGIVRMLVDPLMASHVCEDLDGVEVLEGSSGEIDKRKHPDLTHISDALGYYTNKEFPATITALKKQEVLGV